MRTRIVGAVVFIVIMSGIMWWRDRQEAAFARLEAAKAAATDASRRMTAADRAIADEPQTCTVAVATSFLVVEPSADSRAKLSAQVHVAVAGFEADITAREQVLTRAAEWFALDPSQEPPVHEALGKIRDRQQRLRAIRDALGALARGLDSGAKPEDIQNLTSQVNAAAMIDAIVGSTTGSSPSAAPPSTSPPSAPPPSGSP